MTAGIITNAIQTAGYVDGMTFSDVMAALLAVFDDPKEVLEFMAEVDLEVDCINQSRKGRQAGQNGFLAYKLQTVMMVVELLTSPV